jgi:signal transduction histidine kinase
MFGKWKLTERTRMLLQLELAITLPAVALMVFSISNLKSIQRDQAIEGAIQREFQSMLKVTDQKLWHKANELAEPVRTEFPNPDDGAMEIKAKLDHILAEHPELTYAVLYDKQNNFVIARMQTNGSHDDNYCVDAQNATDAAGKWLPVEGSMYVEKLRMMEEKDDHSPYFDGEWWMPKGRRVYMGMSMFLPPGIAKDRTSLGLIGFDDGYLLHSLFPAVMQEVLNNKTRGMKNDPNPPAMMVHASKDWTPLVTSPNWDGGKAEVEMNSSVFPGMYWGIKYQGTTIADIGARFLRYNYAVLGALSVLMIGGIFLTYRNISREMNLARLKSDFVANVSHELRTPLALIRLYAETLELGRITAKEKYHEYFRIIREESERLTALINNILDFSRIEAGRKEYEFKETDLPQLVRSTLDSYRFQIEQHGFTFEENIASDIPPMNVDREAIARSLLNLVNNALKYSKDKKFIGVSLYRSNGSVKLEVRDQGIGIPADEQEKIFEKFYRCGDPLVHNIKGSGLGLSLVRHIARAHGGEVHVESTPDKGSKFTIALPLDPVRNGATAA